MIYAIASIGLLGFLVWSWHTILAITRRATLASLYSDINNKINFAICWKDLKIYSTLKCKNLYSYIQSAGNLSLVYIYYFIFNYIQSASETTREISFNFSKFNTYFNILNNNNELLYNNLNSIPDDLLIWLIGFIEGDGAIQSYSNNTKIKFVLTQKESNVLYFIQKFLGIGHVKYFPQGKSNNNNGFYRLIVEKHSHLLLLTYLFNGNLVLTHRINQLSLWVNYFNIKFNKNIKLINKSANISLQDPWLSGFTDAEGCFNVSITNNKKYKLNSVIKLKYILDQKDENILNIIKDLFDLGKVTYRSDTEGVYRYTITGYKSINKVISYFNKYPLYTKKALSYKYFNIIYNKVINKEHLTIEGFNEIKRLKKLINLNVSNIIKTGKAGKI